jgi:hypothetical protein
MRRRLLQPPADKQYALTAPPGYEVVLVKRTDAKLVDGGNCRRPGCRRTAVWALDRSYRRFPGASRVVPWRYCDWHTYGNEIRDDGVYRHVLRKIGDTDVQP